MPETELQRRKELSSMTAYWPLPNQVKRGQSLASGEMRPLVFYLEALPDP
ncbi:hypothetical protein FLM9_1361 [Candidatus Synechococcus spongiarum]|uniref:Uncharacterized protein n=1 Tax=Candidatus Synechococcus spongiarum TaxID=431041 RepID=A0A164YYK5_9SYNE|nr:hypothetical protein FLM9_1361 [Candidatus Synechococcus spongiarum]